MAVPEDKQKAGEPHAAGKTERKIQWDDSAMQHVYANVFSVAWTQEEISLLFGMNQAWNAGQSEIRVQLGQRVVLSPFLMKKLFNLFGHVIRDYEAKFGNLDNAESTAKQLKPLLRDIPDKRLFEDTAKTFH